MPKLASYFDLFSVKPVLYIRGSRVSSSSLGKISSIFVYAFAVWAILYLSEDFVNRKNPNVSQSNYLGIEAQSNFSFDFNTFQYMFAVKGADDQTFVQKDNIFNVSAAIHYSDKTVPIKLQKCSRSDVNWVVPFDGAIFCFDRNQILELQGVYSNIEIKIDYCKGDGQTSCLDQQSIESYISTAKIYFIYPRFSLDPKNFKTPIQRSWDYIEISAVPNLVKKVNAIVKSVVMTTDDNWLISSYSSARYSIHDTMYTDIEPGINSTSIAKFKIFTLGDKDIITRIYPKFQSLVAQLFGLVQLVWLIIKFLIVPYSKFKIYEAIGNEAFSLSISQKNARSTTEREQRKRVKNLSFIATIIKNNSNTGSKEEIPSDKKKEDFQSTNDIKDSHVQSKFSTPSEKLDPKSTGHMRNGSAISEAHELLAINTLNSEMKITPNLNLHGGDIGSFESDEAKVEIPIQEKEQPTENNQDSEKNPRINVDSIRNEYHRRSSGVERQAKKRKIFYNTDTKEVHFSISYFEWIASMFRTNPKIVLLKQLKKEITKRLDIVTISKKLIEVEILKNLMLSDHQRVLFDNLKPPKLKLCIPREGIDKSGKLKDYYFKTDDFLDTYHGQKELVKSAYDALYNDENKGVIERKLISRYKQFDKKTHMHMIAQQSRAQLNTQIIKNTVPVEI